VRNSRLLPSRGSQELLDEKYAARTLTANKLSEFGIVISSTRRASKLLHWRTAQRADPQRCDHVEREFLFYVPLPFALDLIDHCVDLARGAGIVDLQLSARFPES
jgi:hypothetical protein